MIEDTKGFITVGCECCGAKINIKAYREQYINDLIAYAKRSHNALKQLIDSNKVSGATKIYYPNGEYDTVGNIRAEAPHKY